MVIYDLSGEANPTVALYILNRLRDKMPTFLIKNVLNIMYTQYQYSLKMCI